MYGSLDISTSGLVAQRTRLNVISANIANAQSLTNADGDYEPYRRRFAQFSAGDPSTGSEMGVHVSSIGIDQGDLEGRYNPASPFANEDGYVYYPNVHIPTEQMNAMEAMRAYEANITAIEATKAMMNIALQMLG